MNRFLTSIGAHTVRSAPRDVKILVVVRFIRLLGYGGTTFILASTTGLFMTATLLGDLAISFILTYMGDRMGVRLTSAIARLSTPSRRNEIFVWWSMVGMLGTAGSNLITCWGLTAMKNSGVAKRDSYRVIFLMYAAMGLVKLVGTLAPSKNVEVIVPAPGKKGCEDAAPHGEYPPSSSEEEHAPDQTAALLNPATPPPDYGTTTPTTSTPPRLFTPSSLAFMWRLSLALFFDFVCRLRPRPNLLDDVLLPARARVLGTATFSAVRRRLVGAQPGLVLPAGAVPTMVACHSVNSASLLLLLVAVPGKNGVGLFVFRIKLQAFVSGGVGAEERTSAMGVCVGLYLTGVLAGAGRFGVAFGGGGVEVGV
ncbi:multidrug resistance [Podospora conica]|nr:multidrug resistance [Schizothecium conicum]